MSEGRNGTRSASARARDPDVYFISGHGGEGGLKKIRLPKGCTVIVRPKPGQYSISKAVAEAARTMFCESSDIYRRPLDNLQHLVNTFGSLAVYKEGELCPNFKFKLLMNHSRDRYEYIAPVSGLIPLPRNDETRKNVCEVFSGKLKRCLDTKPAKDVLPMTYKYSVHPTEKDVLGIIQDYQMKYEEEEEEDEDEDEDEDEFVDIATVIEDEDSPFYVHLSDLLDIHKGGVAKRPGVFYNFSCRSTRDISGAKIEIYDFEKLGNKDGVGLVYPSHGVKIPSVPPKLTEKEKEDLPKQEIRKLERKREGQLAVRQLLLDTIAEAEGKRKHLLRGTRFNRPTVSPRASRGGGWQTRKVRGRRQRPQDKDD